MTESRSVALSGAWRLAKSLRMTSGFSRTSRTSSMPRHDAREPICRFFGEEKSTVIPLKTDVRGTSHEIVDDLADLPAAGPHREFHECEVFVRGEDAGERESVAQEMHED